MNKSNKIFCACSTILLCALLGCSGGTNVSEPQILQPVIEGTPTLESPATEAPANQTKVVKTEEVESERSTETPTETPTTPATIEVVPTATDLPEEVELSEPIRFIGYSLEEETSLSGNGWRGYRLAIAFENTTDSVIPHTLIPFAGDISVETTTGEIYDAYIVKIRDFNIATNPLTSIDFTKTDYRQTVPLPPGMPVTAEALDTMVSFYRDSWAAVFQVPETLAPSRLLLPGYQSVDLQAISHVDGTVLEPLDYYFSLPITIPIDDTKDAEVLLDQARLIPSNGGPNTFLAVNLDLKSNNLTGNTEVDYSFSLVDQTGALYSGYFMGCDGSARDYALRDVLPIVGPGQIVEGIVCFPLGEYQLPYYEGDYVLTAHVGNNLVPILLEGVR